MGGSASMRAATLVNAEQAPKRVMRKSTAGKTGKAAIGWEASDERTGRFRRGIGGGTHTRGGWTQHGKPCRWCARYTVTSIDVLLRNVHSNTNFPTISINSGATLPGTIVATLQTPTSGASAGDKPYRYAERVRARTHAVHRSAMGRTASATGQLWSVRDAAELERDSEFEATGQLAMDAGYGFGLGSRRGVLTPYAGMTLGDGDSRTVRSGARWQLNPDAVFGLEATR